MIRCAICDDDIVVANQIESFVCEADDKFECDVFYSSKELFDNYNEKDCIYDVFFLDIEMNEISGIELAKEIRKKDINALIVFITSHTGYVYDVFEIVTFDFIIKPITKEKIEALINKIKKYLNITKNKFVFCYNKNTYSIPYNEILYLDKLGRKILIYTNDKKGNTYQSNMNLKEVWNQLDDKMFASLSKSCIVNMRWITSIDKEYVVLDGKYRLYISREYRKELKRRHLKFLEVQL